ncbi:MAG: hypothetical protein F4X40_08745 [Chloroflexi bacterium]|nr:hypothetical protein [Chloroflexota bacterium]
MCWRLRAAPPATISFNFSCYVFEGLHAILLDAAMFRFFVGAVAGDKKPVRALVIYINTYVSIESSAELGLVIIVMA